MTATLNPKDGGRGDRPARVVRPTRPPVDERTIADLHPALDGSDPVKGDVPKIGDPT